jgi:lysophospholipid acyltransferase (LPLAT)-like uncharacterized protein
LPPGTRHATGRAMAKSRNTKFRTPKAFKVIVRHPWLKGFFALALGNYLAFVLRTTQWQFEGLEHLEPVFQNRHPCILTFWHERLPMMPRLALRSQQEGIRMRTHVLVSRHNDGRFIGRVVGRFGLDTVIGSSSSGGRESLRRMLLLLREGHNVAITPDGPRGPAKVAAFGVAQVAAATGVPVVPAAAQCRWHFRLPSWDSMVVPFPFGRGAIVCGPAILVPRQGWAEFVPMIAAAIDAVSRQSDRLCNV